MAHFHLLKNYMLYETELGSKQKSTEQFPSNTAEVKKFTWFIEEKGATLTFALLRLAFPLAGEVIGGNIHNYASRISVQVSSLACICS